jgi:hypothetical protein
MQRCHRLKTHLSINYFYGVEVWYFSSAVINIKL